MGKVLAGITVSLDGYVTGPDDRPGAGLGEGGERLHYWVFGGPWTYESGARGMPAGPDQAYLDETFGSVGAWIVGRTMHDVVNGWGDDPGFGVPVFVVTSRPQETVVKGDTRFEFVTGGIREALDRAREAAGERDVRIGGGVSTIRQYLAERLIDELHLVISPVLLGRGEHLLGGLDLRALGYECAEHAPSDKAIAHVVIRKKED